MKQLPLKQIIILCLIFAIAGAVLFCGLTSVAPDRSMEGMPVHQDGFALHFSHIQELTLAKATAASWISVILLLAASLFTLISVRWFDASLPGEKARYIRYVENYIPHIGQAARQRWLSLFEQSPNFLRPA